MPTLYLDRQGSRLGASGGRLILTHPDGKKSEFPSEQVDQVLAYGRVTLGPSALGILLKRGVPCALLSSHGRLRGYLHPPSGGQVQRRARQYAVMQSAEESLALAQALVAAKLSNQHWLLRYWNIRQWGIPAGLRRHISSARRQSSLDALRGIEGVGAREYFSWFPRVLKGSMHAFPGRIKHPSTDPVNALLSFGLYATAQRGANGRDCPWAGSLRWRPACE